MIEFNKKADVQNILKQSHIMQREDFFKARQERHEANNTSSFKQDICFDIKNKDYIAREEAHGKIFGKKCMININ